MQFKTLMKIDSFSYLVGQIASTEIELEVSFRFVGEMLSIFYLLKEFVDAN